MYQRTKLIPIYGLYLVTFGLASFEKLSASGVPGWFAKQFGFTVIDVFPGSLAMSYYGIGLLEGLVAAAILLSLARREFLPGRSKRWLLGALSLSQMVFVLLGFGQRLTHDYNGAANLFFYFGATLLALLYVERQAALPSEQNQK